MLSGDESLQCSQWSVLADLINSAKKKVFVFGSGDDDEEYCYSSGWELAPIEKADLIVARGTFTINDGTSVLFKRDEEKEYFDALEKFLSIASDRKVPMLVTNPDKVRPDKNFSPMPGAIGDHYERLLAPNNDTHHLVKRIGKPHPEVYALALNGNDPASTVMVGDALETDVTGGARNGCSTLWIVEDGIHGPAVEAKGSGNFEDGVMNVLNSFNEKERNNIKDEPLLPTFVTKKNFSITTRCEKFINIFGTKYGLRSF